MKKIIIMCAVSVIVLTGCSVNNGKAHVTTSNKKNNNRSTISSQSSKAESIKHINVVSIKNIESLEFNPQPLSQKPPVKFYIYNAKQKRVIEKIVSWLNTSELTKRDEPPYGKHGYPPSFTVNLKNEDSILVEPAYDIYTSKDKWGSFKTSSPVKGGIVVEYFNHSGTPVLNSRMRLKSPEVLNWMNENWKLDVSSK